MNTEPRRPRGRPRLNDPRKPPGTVAALDRGLGLLAALAETGPTSLTELALTTSNPPSTVHRMLMTLAGHGLADFNEAKQTWTVGVEAFRIGAAFTRQIGRAHV